MRSHARISLLALLATVLVVFALPAAAQAAPGIAKFEALSCNENKPEGVSGECSNSTPAQFFKQAGGHPNFGITDFSLNYAEFEGPGNGVKSIRTDLPIGFSTNPEALPRCSQADFAANFGKAEESHCPASSQAGTQEITLLLPGPTVLTLTGKVYNLVPPQGLGLEFGTDVALPFLGGIHVHSFLEGFVSWHKEAEATAEGIASGDYHEFFRVKVAKSLSEGEAPILRSRLITEGTLGNGLLTNPTACPGPQTNHLRVETYTGAIAYSEYKTSVTAAEEKCNLLSFEPAFTNATTPQVRDEGTELTTDVKFPLNTKSSETEGSDLKTTSVTLPAGFAINPSAARGLQACTQEQLLTETIETACPSRSEIGTAVISVPGLPPESLTGKIFLGATSLPITGPPYSIYVAVGSKRYGQVIRLEGSVKPNLETGQLETTFANIPQGPSTDTKLTFNGGTFADLANPLSCGAGKTQASFIPYSNPGETKLITPELNVTGGNCPATAGFALTQAAGAEPPLAAGSSTFSLNLQRADGQQYLQSMSTLLPKGLVGLIPAVTQCAEPQANAGSCTSASQIGTASVLAGAGPEPFEFTGKVYLTGPYAGAPFGLSIVTPVIAGPFNFGNEVTRAKIEVNKTTAQVIATATLPTIKQGVPIKLRSLTVTVNRQGFERNPTNCAVQAVQSSLTSTEGASQLVSTPFQAEGCSALAFKPTFAATTSAKTSKVNGASLETTINQPAGQANIQSVLVKLPAQLPSRLTTLQKACPEATFAANPYSCPAASNVGTARANTPVLPAKMAGPAYLVSHGGAAFPDLDLVLEANGVRVIVVGNTDIKKGVTTTNFATAPDVPVSSITVSLPTGPHSALAAFGNLCVKPLLMPTVITGQNGKQVKQNTKISVKSCGVQIVGKKVIGNTAYLTVKTFGAGRLTGTGSGVSRVSRSFNSAQNAVSLKIPLSSGGRSRHRPFKVHLKVSFKAKSRSVVSSSTATTVTFR
jgi:hypothetical protein